MPFTDCFSQSHMDDDFNFNHVCPQYRTFIDMKYKGFNVMLGAFINLSENVEVKLDNIII